MKTIILWAVLDVHLATLSEILTCPARLVQIITYSKGRRDEMILSIHLFRRPSVQSIRPIMVCLLRRGGENSGVMGQSNWLL
jgi:hypothetical protein